MKTETDELLTIGRFARLSGLTVKALRHYDEIGLLEPARVDTETAYRYYARSQVRTGEAIRRLRSLEVPLDEIATLLNATDDVVRERLAVHRARLEGRAVETQRILAQLDRLIEGKETLVPEIGEQEVRIRFHLSVQEAPEMHVLVIRERAHTDEMSKVIPRNIDEVAGYLKEIDRPFYGPPICISPFPGDDGTAEIEVGWPVPDGTPGRGPIEAKTLPKSRALVMEHRGPYEELSRSYRLMAEAMERHGMSPAGDPIEIYATDPEEVPDPNDYETRIVWPIGPEGELKIEGDVFKRRLEHP